MNELKWCSKKRFLFLPVYLVSNYSYGWCGTMHNYTSLADQKVNVSESDGWGFCQRSCFPSDKSALGGIERYKRVHVIDPEFCRKQILNSGPALKVEPKVLCVAFNHTYHTTFYEQTDEKTYEKLPTNENLNRLLNRNRDWYIVGTGKVQLRVGPH